METAVCIAERKVTLSIRGAWFLVLFLITLSAPDAFAENTLEDFTEAPGMIWGELFSSDAAACSLARTDNGYMVAGRQSGAVGPGIDEWAVLAEFDRSGNLADSRTFENEADHNVAYAVIPSRSDKDEIDGYVVTGYKHKKFPEEPDGEAYYDPWVWLLKTDLNLNKLWEKQFGDPFSDWGNSVIQDGSGFVIGGWKGLGPTTGSGSGYMIRTDGSGNLAWEAALVVGDETTYWLSKEIHSVQATPDNGYILGTSSGIVKVAKRTGGLPPAFVWYARTPSGELVGECYYSVKPTSDGGYIGVGEKLVKAEGKPDQCDLILTKLTSGGVVSWSVTFGRDTPVLGASGMDDTGRDVIETSDGGYAVTGSTWSFGWHGGADLWLIKTDGYGVMEWDLALGGEGNDGGNALVETEAGTYVVVGSASWEGASWMWIVKAGGDFRPPIPSFTFSPESPFFMEEPVHFDGSSSTDPDGAIVSYEWDFGDGRFGLGEIINHTFIQPGEREVTLYVTDDSGVRRDVSRAITANELKVQWQRFFGDSRDYGFDLLLAPDGYVISGLNCPATYCDLWVFKTDRRGKLTWSQTFDYAYRTEAGRAVTYAHEGDDGREGYVVAGYRDAGRREVWLMKIAADTGERIWEQAFRLAWRDGAFDIKPVADGYIITGRTGDDLHYDVWLIKTDVNGDMDWNRIIPDPGGDRTVGHAVSPTVDGGYVITGGYDWTGGDGPLLTIKTDSEGYEQWRSNVGPAGSESGGRWVYQTQDLGYAVVGFLDGDLCLLKLTPGGAQEWVQTWGPELSRWDFAEGAATTVDRGFIIAGKIVPEKPDPPLPYYKDELYIVRTDEEGNPGWEKAFNIGEDIGVGVIEEGQDVISFSDGSFVVLSSVAYGGPGSTWLLKLGPNDPPTIADISYDPEEPGAGRPVSFTVSGAQDPDGAIDFYEWIFGNGEEMVTVDPEVQYTYPAGGIYTVRVAVVDDDGGEAFKEREIIVAGMGDLDGDGVVGLSDAILGFQTAAGLAPTENVWMGADVDGDGRVGLVEAIWDLQKLGGLRPSP
jgi:hypothetical protein